MQFFNLSPYSAVIGNDGVIYIGSGSALYAIRTTSLGLASSPWPMFHHDQQHTGRAP
jgi:hypothetical protein